VSERDEPEERSCTAVVITVVAIVAATIVVPIVHYNQARYLLESDCRDAGGNWETREHSNEIGCRFQGKTK
jgi:hypothetical protein